MSACTFLAADCPLPEHKPERDYPLHIDLDRGIIDDGGAADNFFLLPFRDVGAYTDKAFGAVLEWQYTPGRAERLIGYIDRLLEQTECVQLWRVWLADRYDFEERPSILRCTLSAGQLHPEDLQQLQEAVIWKPGEARPCFYCMEIRRGGPDAALRERKD